MNFQMIVTWDEKDDTESSGNWTPGSIAWIANMKVAAGAVDVMVKVYEDTGRGLMPVTHWLFTPGERLAFLTRFAGQDTARILEELAR